MPFKIRYLIMLLVFLVGCTHPVREDISSKIGNKTNISLLSEKERLVYICGGDFYQITPLWGKHKAIFSYKSSNIGASIYHNDTKIGDLYLDEEIIIKLNIGDYLSFGYINTIPNKAIYFSKKNKKVFITINPVLDSTGSSYVYIPGNRAPATVITNGVMKNSVDVLIDQPEVVCNGKKLINFIDLTSDINLRK